jgi:hypothetical protein
MNETYKRGLRRRLYSAMWARHIAIQWAFVAVYGSDFPCRMSWAALCEIPLEWKR